MREPSAAMLGRVGVVSAANRLFLATRPLFFPVSVLPVLVGTAWGAGISGAFAPGAFALAVIAVLCVHAGANVLNDFFDDKSGADASNKDRIYPFTGGSRFIQNGILTSRQILYLGLALLGAAAAAGLVLFALKGWPVLALGVIGAGLGVLYSAPPAAFAGRSLGLVSVGAAFGLLPVMGAAWLQSGLWEIDGFILSLILGLWTAAILLVNDIPDAGADAAAGKQTLVSRIGPEQARWFYLGINAGAAALVGLMVIRGVLPAATLAVPVLGMAAAAYGALHIEEGWKPARLKQTIIITLGIHGAGSLWLLFWIWSTVQA